MVTSLTNREQRATLLRWGLFGLLALASAAGAVGSDKFGKLWIVPAIAAILVVALQPLIERIDEGRLRRQRIRDQLVRWPLTVDTASPYDDLRISWSRKVDAYSPNGQIAPYVEREVDDEVAEALRREPFVLLIGPSKAGKSRTAYEAARKVFGGASLLVPRRPAENHEGLKELSESLDELGDLEGRPLLLWLDDLQDFLRARAVDISMLKAWRERRPPLTVLATIRETEFHALREEERLGGGRATLREAIGKETFEVLDRATQVRLEATLLERELVRAEAAYPDEDFSAGIGAQLIDAQRLIDRLDSAPATCPQGGVIVRATIDFERSGVLRPVSRDELFALARIDSYREDLPRGTLFTADHLQAGLDWALERLDSGIAPLYSADDAGETFEAFDYLIAYADGEVQDGEGRRPIPLDTWEATLELVSSEDAFYVGLSAWQRGNLRAGLDGLLKAEEGLEDSEDKLIAAILAGAAQRDLGEYEEACIRLERAVRRAEELDDMYSLILALAHRGAAFLALGDVERGENDLRQSVELAERESEPELLTLGLRLLAMALLRLERVPEALEAARRAMDVTEEVEAEWGEGLNTLESLAVLGFALRRAGELDEAAEVLDRCVQLAEDALGSDSIFLAAGLHGRGLVRLARDNPAGAKADLERALAIYETVVGPDHPVVGELLGSVAKALEAVGEPNRALDHLDRALAIQEAAFDGDDHPSIGDALTTRAGVRRRLGDLAGAQQDLERAVLIRRRVFGDSSLSVAYTLHDLGVVMRFAGDLAAAEANLDRAVALKEQALGPNALQLGYSLHELGVVKRMAGDLAGAEADLGRAIAINDESGTQDVHAAYTIYERGVVRRMAGELPGAGADFEKAVAIYMKASGPEDIQVAHALHELGVVKRMAGDLRGAEADLDRAVAIKTRSVGPDDAQVAYTLHQRGIARRDAGELASAADDLERALATAERALGPNDAEVGYILQDLGVLKRLEGDLASAKSHQSRALELARAERGDDDAYVGTILHELGIALRDLREYGPAKRALEWSLAVLSISDESDPRGEPILADLAPVLDALHDAVPASGATPARTVDGLLDAQRAEICDLRRRALQAGDLSSEIEEWRERVIQHLVDAYACDEDPVTWELEALLLRLGNLYPVAFAADDPALESLERDELIGKLLEDLALAYDEREQALGEELMRALERFLLLQILDEKWRTHRDAVSAERHELQDRIETEGAGAVQAELGDRLTITVAEDFLTYAFNVEVSVDS